ncbi:MAG: hybrid sensor histidine kinase/response regulator [Rhizobiales bacterium]|nr:hybrid sensor histidine kinase/response regulator [Hyphomicrobiales bacterium]MBO6700288.1 hybrid sensor histidine kinase/response regulator [Hyphomicrobiales bacterium]MBO6737547.1 hybrid sensor histidine kinase/response regulator [Hyphomicrobiales bacterium]MBO6913396.1 hybrid sensor histidine kinase/response regulator [Hyphomicrobiales bacterium]MBO6955808.1 hybrid sensor histidine kinase/response regulator [Hyphomicrobiales bacterium]
MDDLLLEFLTETNESLDVVDVELVKFEQDPNNAQILDNIFRLVHTIKGTCGFLGLPRLESLAHAAETLMGKYRDGCPVTTDGVSLILLSIDRLKAILADLEASGSEPAGDDQDLISELERMALAADETDAAAAEDVVAEEPEPAPEPEPEEEREVRVGEVPLDELDRIFNETESDYDAEAAAKQQMEEALAEVKAKAGDAEADTEAPEADAAPEPVKAEAPKAEAKPAPAKKADAKGDQKAAPGASGEAKPNGEKSLASQSIRVSVDTLENLMTMVSELVLTRNQLLEIVRRHEDSEFKVPLQRLSNVTAELQEGVMKTRMQPIGNAWQKLPRIVRDLAGELGKDIDLEMVGAETELDRQVLDLIKDPLTHMVRNSADHGLELPSDRAAVGKPEKGTIKLSAYHEGGHIIIEIADDGKGLPTELLKKKAIDNELYTEAEIERMSETQIHKLIFHPGLSTAAKVTNVSGRGVGMDVVRTNIEAIGGTIDLKSKEGHGTVVMIKIPLTLAIVSTLIVESSGERFAIPQLAVVELVRAQKDSEHKIETIRNTPVLRLRDKLLPLSPLSHLLGAEPANEPGDIGEEGFIVVMQVGNQTFGLVVDAVFHTEEIVVKPMSSMLRHLAMFSGNTILGDGSVIMILDPNGIANAIGSAIDSEVAEQAQTEEKVMTSDEAQSVSLLVFRAGGEEPKAVMLSLVTRLEEIQTEAIEHANDRDLVQYRGNLMPLVKVTDNMQLRDKGTQPMLVFADEHRSMGLMVDEIVDIVDEVLDIEVTSEKPGVLGSAVIKGKATEVIDVGYFMPLAFDDWFMMKDVGSAQEKFDVLLVDDSTFFRNMLGPVLRSAGYSVTTCEDAQEALELLEEGRQFDAIVSDIEMPGLSGYEFTTQVRKDARYADTPIIAMSAHATPAAIQKGRDAGFSDYVAKFDRTGLIAAIKEQTSEVELAA